MSVPKIGASEEVIRHHVTQHPCGDVADHLRLTCPCQTTIVFVCGACDEPLFLANREWCEHADAAADGDVAVRGPLCWRAVADRWSEGDGDTHWYGRWRPQPGAMRQAARWQDSERVLELWVEGLSSDGWLMRGPDARVLALGRRAA